MAILHSISLQDASGVDRRKAESAFEAAIRAAFAGDWGRAKAAGDDCNRQMEMADFSGRLDDITGLGAEWIAAERAGVAAAAEPYARWPDSAWFLITWGGRN